VYQEYQWDYQGLRHLAIHGHQFDGFVLSNVRVSYFIGTLLYMQLQKWDSKKKTLTRFLDRLNTRWLRLSPKVASGALAHARYHQAARIFCGHTHAAMHKHDAEHGIDYYNCGAWIDARPTYITVSEKGVQIHEYVEEAERAVRVGEERGDGFEDEFEDGVSEDREHEGEHEKVGR
jgi:UDP-2,3-diacylglucosamine pyrophosphatase LpxH